MIQTDLFIPSLFFGRKMTSSSPRETIQISLGPSANAITAHLLNLQGLASTSSSSCSDNVICDPNTTHFVQGSNHRGSGTLVPRVLIVDEANHQVPATLMTKQGVKSQGSMYQNHSHTSDPPLSGFYANSFWDGNLQVLGDDELSSTTRAAWNSGLHNVVDASRSTSSFRQTASAMAYSPYSRYYTTEVNDQPIHQYRTDPDNSRHVVWDDGEEDEEDPSERDWRQEQSERHWKKETAVGLGQQLDRHTAEKFQKVCEGIPPEESLLSSSAIQQFDFNHWTDIWMPPRSEKSKVVLPFSSQSQLVPHWNVSYHNDGNNSSSTTPFLQEWKEDTLLESVRHMLEACDYGIQGVSISTQGHGIYASLATSLLEELKQECKSAGRLVYHLRNENNNVVTNISEGMPETTTSPLSWQEAKVDQIRKHVSSGLVLHDFTENAHAVLPLRLPGGNQDGINDSSSRLSFFRSTAQIAMALEASTLPFRFNGNISTTAGFLPVYQIGLQNAPFLAQGSSDTSWGSTATRLTFSEYLQVLQPSSSHSMLELDAVSHSRGVNGSISNEKLFEIIQEGTSVERDRRTKQSRGHSCRTRPREVSPGSWLRGGPPDSNGTKCLLSSLSYCTSKKNLDRSLHHHFALSTSVRPMLSSSGGSEAITMSNYLTCLVQGMGIQYRPERSMATVLNQSLGQMTFGIEGGGSNYGAGIYWKYIVPQVDTPILAVLGNSTRAYASLNEISTDMKVAMKSPRFRGYYNRDVSNGVLPELEDCEEALEACWNKRDVYHPPSGSGLVSEEDY